MEVYTITPNLRLLNLQPPIPGYEKFIGSYLFSGEKNALVDVGPKAAIPNLFTLLDKLDISPKEIDYIILTHIHVDHAGGVGTAVKKMPRAKIITHSRARAHLINPAVLWEASLKTLGELALKYGEIEPVPEDMIIVATDNMKLDLGHGLELEIHITPGHAPHHLSVYHRASGVLIAGEAAGVCLDGAIRLATPPPFRLEDTLASIDSLAALQPKKLCYGHFGCYDNVQEKLSFVRQKVQEWYETVNSPTMAGKSADEIFAGLRKTDRSLDYLNKMSKDAYDREYALLINCINGLASPPKAK